MLGEDMHEFVEVSPEMTLALGGAVLADAPLPPNAMALLFNAEDARPTLTIDRQPDLTSLAGEDRLLLIIDRAAFERVGGRLSHASECHLPSPLRAIVIAIRDRGLTGETLKVYR